MRNLEDLKSQAWDAVVIVRAAIGRVYEMDSGGQLDQMVGDTMEPAQELQRLLGIAVDRVASVACVVDRLPPDVVELAIGRLNAEGDGIEADETANVHWVGASEPLEVLPSGGQA